MSADYHRPTLTYPSGAYNATQVRLYGLLPDLSPCGIVYPGQAPLYKLKSGDLEIAVSVTTGDPERDKEQAAIVQHLLGEGGPSEDKLTAAQQFLSLLNERADEAPTAAVGYFTQVSVEMRKLGKVAFTAMITREQALSARKVITCGIIVGYAYEGHTYDLAKPKIMIIPAFPEPRIPKDDSGFDAKENRYAVWLVDKLDECVEFELNQGFVEQIVLDANLPGKRAPNMYSGRMMMGHRSGRLSE